MPRSPVDYAYLCIIYMQHQSINVHARERSDTLCSVLCASYPRLTAILPINFLFKVVSNGPEKRPMGGFWMSYRFVSRNVRLSSSFLPG